MVFLLCRMLFSTSFQLCVYIRFFYIFSGCHCVWHGAQIEDFIWIMREYLKVTLFFLAPSLSCCHFLLSLPITKWSKHSTLINSQIKQMLSILQLFIFQTTTTSSSSIKTDALKGINLNLSTELNDDDYEFIAIFHAIVFVPQIKLYFVLKFHVICIAEYSDKMWNIYDV